MDVVDLSRLQFAMTALYHFLFVPLTLGLAVILAIMETVWIMTGRPIWRDMVKFWGTLFGINFAMGVATGITMEFQFGTNWAYYAHYVGDVFGAPLAIEGLMAFFLEATMVGLFFFGWKRLSRIQHWVVTCLLALGTNLSAVDPHRQCLDAISGRRAVQFRDHAHGGVGLRRRRPQPGRAGEIRSHGERRLCHRLDLRHGDLGVVPVEKPAPGARAPLARRRLELRPCLRPFSGRPRRRERLHGEPEPEDEGRGHRAMWETEPAPASFTAIGIPDQKAHVTRYAVKVPWLLGLIATRSVDQEVPGIADLVVRAKERIKSGIIAFAAVQSLRANPNDSAARENYEAHIKDMGYALLLKRYAPNVVDATPEQIERASWDTVPSVAPIFWSFRIMAGIGFFFIALFAWAFVLSSLRRFEKSKLFLRVALFSLPLPWIAAELGWYIAETGRQPWTIDGILPTFLSVSSVSATNVWLSLSAFVIFYSILAVVDVVLMLRAIRTGPHFSPDEKEPAALRELAA